MQLKRMRGRRKSWKRRGRKTNRMSEKEVTLESWARRLRLGFGGSSAWMRMGSRKFPGGRRRL